MNIKVTSASKQWWQSKRSRYNKGLVMACLIAFILYCIPSPVTIVSHEEFGEIIVGIMGTII